MKLHYKLTSVNSIDDVYGMFPSGQFKSPTRSTIPLLSWLKYEAATVAALINNLGITGDYGCHLEYTVTAPQGQNSHSQTDFMVLGRDTALAIECKWTESFDDTVEKWLAKGNQANRSTVLEAWVQLLRRVSKRELNSNCFHQVINQMIHRSASACLAGEHPKLAYLLFHPSPDKNTTGSSLVREELAHLWRLLGRPQEFDFSIIEIGMAYTEVYETIALLPKDSDETSVSIMTALASSERLFQFKEPVIQRIGVNA